MTKNNNQIAATREHNINQQLALTNPIGYCIIEENRPKGKGNVGGVAFITNDNFVAGNQTSDRNLEDQAIELSAYGKNIKLANTYIPPFSSSKAG